MLSPHIGCYHGADTIVDYVNNWSLKAANLSHDSEAELVYLVEESDALVVLIQSGQVLDIRFVSFPDVDDEDPNESEVVDYGQWTSLRECTGIWKPRSFKAAVDETDTDSFRHLFKRLKMSVQ
ncbi:hypothetical protein HBH70_155220 [Parastagonospora nodorum]|nr:hypothetical protein HBH50_041720 [Parastagonospora nodorum]KAH4091548.1 hypothetical protein HBH48_094040 [Parastagonospora nodorum]KAH4103332.1 hypothetical protein HBH46_117660 [Parastagonospora nodorum]KAH4256212.1 hypothetical protein HBI03_167940 [Parastagonospora nodorum]KAH4268753.1 hypothetical protein HBI04_162150 [Parastagonospora nodorum]